VIRLRSAAGRHEIGLKTQPDELLSLATPPWSRSVYERFPLAIDGSGRVTRHSENARPEADLNEA